MLLYVNDETFDKIIINHITNKFNFDPKDIKLSDFNKKELVSGDYSEEWGSTSILKVPFKVDNVKFDLTFFSQEEENIMSITKEYIESFLKYDQKINIEEILNDTEYEENYYFVLNFSLEK